MFFILLAFIVGFSIEGIGTLVSVIGLSALFGSNPIIIALAIALDLGKIVVVTFLYKYWKTAGILMRTYALIAAVITMIITSAGASGYLSGEFQKAIMGTQETALKVDVLKQQQAKFQDRKKQIDDQIAALPTKTTVNQRLRLMNGFKAEQQDLDSKIAALDTQLPDLQIAQISVEAKAGPIIYISKAFGISVEEAVKWVILMIIFVFDPLAVFLIIVGNSLLEQRRAKLDAEKKASAETYIRPSTILPDSVALNQPEELKVTEEVSVPVRQPEVIPEIVQVESEYVEPVFTQPEKSVTWPTVEDMVPSEVKEVVLSAVVEVPQEVPKPQPIETPVVIQDNAAAAAEKAAREQVTLSSLGHIREDPDTIVDAGSSFNTSTNASIYK